jgi:hypothetical protein
MYRQISSALAAVLVVGQAAALVAQNAEPTKVFVVNTQDASVSLVDLKAMREEKRFPVGQRQPSSSSHFQTASQRAKC